MVESVSPVSARAGLGDRADVAGDAVRHLAQLAAERGVEVRDPLVGVVVGVAALAARPCPDTCTGVSGRSVPENTRTSETRPDVRVDGGLDHLGDQRAGRVAGQRLARRAVQAGDRAAAGAPAATGSALVSTSSSASRPTPVAAQTGSTG